jgi:hypothetical protein
MILRRDQLREVHIRGVEKLLHWKEHKETVVNDLLDDLSPDRWSDSIYPEDMAQDLHDHRDRNITLALDFLTRMRATYVDAEDMIGTIPRIHHEDLITMERIYIVAQLVNVFFQQVDNRHWCVQLFQTGALEIKHVIPWVPWNENCWLVSLRTPDGADFWSPAICKLEFTDGLKYFRDSEQLDLKTSARRVIAYLNNQSCGAYTLTKVEYDRFGPALDWHGCLYAGFPDRAVRLEAAET